MDLCSGVRDIYLREDVERCYGVDLLLMCLRFAVSASIIVFQAKM